MSAALFDEQAAAWARDLEDESARRLSLPVVEVRAILARRTGIPAGQFENLRRGRIKGVRAWVWHALKTAYEAERERQLKALAHDLAVTRAITGPDRPAVRAAEALVAASRQRPLSEVVGEGAEE